MTFMTPICTADAAAVLFDAGLLEAILKAEARAPHSYFDQHVLRTDDGCCWVADEGSYETLMQDLADRIILTIPAGRSDES